MYTTSHYEMYQPIITVVFYSHFFLNRLCDENKVYNLFKGIQYRDLQLDPREMPRQWLDAARERGQMDLGGVLLQL